MNEKRTKETKVKDQYETRDITIPWSETRGEKLEKPICTLTSGMISLRLSDDEREGLEHLRTGMFLAGMRYRGELIVTSSQAVRALLCLAIGSRRIS